MYLLGFDIGSSSVKAGIINAETGAPVASAFYPKTEMVINAVKPGWAEQAPSQWWENLKLACAEAIKTSGIKTSEIKAIGISYQMHGLVCLDKDGNVLRPSIIWCDSRAVEIGNKAFADLGSEKCLSHLLNSPGNFTASKLKWVKENEPTVYAKVKHIMLPGDYIAYQLTGELCTTVSGLSEGMMWDFSTNSLAGFLFDYYGFDQSFVPEVKPTFSMQGKVLAKVAAELGIPAGIPVAYRAGDQPNNAFSLNVINPGEIAATAGTSGVVYGVSDQVKYDPQSRVNTFAHVNHANAQKRLGVLLCVNGTGILNSWVKKNTGFATTSYEDMNKLAASIKPGSEGIAILPFGNGAERVLGNRNIGAQIAGLSFNTHTNAHILRASQEGIVFAFNYGMEIMKETGINASVIRAGQANMFLSDIFRKTLATISGATIELYNTDGAQGAARGAGVGAGIYKDFNEAFAGLKKLSTIEPDKAMKAEVQEAYFNWKNLLNKYL